MDARSERNLKGVHPDLVAIVKAARVSSLAVPIGFKVIEGVRTLERQRELVRIGASHTLRSRHLTGHAIDVVALDDAGAVSWHWPLYTLIAECMAQAARRLELPIEWGGKWKLRDGPHFQLPWAAYPVAAPRLKLQLRNVK